MNTAGQKDKEMKKVIESIVAGFVVVIIVSTISIIASFSICAGREMLAKAPRIVTVCPVVALTAAEQSELKSALADFSLGSNDQLNRWVGQLQKSGKYGILPRLPKKYSHEDVVKVGEKRILVPHKK